MRATFPFIVALLFAFPLTQLACKEKPSGSGSATDIHNSSASEANTPADTDLTPPDTKLAKFDLKLNDIAFTVEAPEGSVVKSGSGDTTVTHGPDFGFRIEANGGGFASDKKWWKEGGGIFKPNRYLIDTADQTLLETKESGDMRYSAASLVKLPYVDITVHSAKDGKMGADVQTKANCLLVLKCAKTLAFKSPPPTDPVELLTWLGADLRKLPDGKIDRVTLGSGVTDAALPLIRKLPGLKFLEILGSRISGAGMAAFDGLESIESVTLSPHGRVTAEMFHHVASLPNLTSLSIGGMGRTDLDDAGITELQKAKKLESIVLIQTSMTDSGMAGFKGISSLKELVLGCKQISKDPKNRASMKMIYYSDAGLDALSGLPNLESLSLIRADITGAGLKNLTAAAKLKDLDLTDSLVDDAGLKNISGLKTLESLDLMQTRITDDGLAALEGLANLRSLDLTGTAVTDAGLKHLTGLTKLEELQLRKTAVTDAGLQQVKGLKNLQTLNLGETKVTDAGIGQLGGLKKLLSLYTDKTAVTPDGKKAFEKLRDAE